MAVVVVVLVVSGPQVESTQEPASHAGCTEHPGVLLHHEVVAEVFDSYFFPGLPRHITISSHHHIVDLVVPTMKTLTYPPTDHVHYEGDQSLVVIVDFVPEDLHT